MEWACAGPPDSDAEPLPQADPSSYDSPRHDTLDVQSRSSFFTVESMPLVWDESQLWLMGREGKVLSPDQEQPWTSAPGTAELTWEQWVGAVAESWQR